MLYRAALKADIRPQLRNVIVQKWS